METPDEFEAVAELCIASHEAVMRLGSPEMQTASRMLLYALAEEIRRRAGDEVAPASDDRLQ
ncbi:hypothetical protein [Methylobacterium radiotolerans]|uniref:hypothetical protein n=1 Tax=Methylobacterium radiotolerans TaxID=31998 RepID=UPI000D5FC402|nr:MULTISPECIES: hypothetical protein [Methylobacterium]MDE3746046.1 hypothetical protein [Methylobacterium radiotolerans]PVY97673.1 hypothetical protein C7388_113149 [Methylobacterium organophilum]